MRGLVNGCPASQCLSSILALLPESLPETFDGYRLVLTKPLSNVFQTTHTVNLGSQDGSSYQFGALYAGTKKVAENEVCAFVNVLLNSNHVTAARNPIGYLSLV